jgi:predicted XRE-type DNA-binding protein
MAKTWTEVRAKGAGRLDEKRIAAEKKLLTEAVRAHRLADVRKRQSVTQEHLAGVMKVSQARVSKIERGEISRTEIGTLQAYVEALGGTLRVVADFGDEKLTVE